MNKRLPVVGKRTGKLYPPETFLKRTSRRARVAWKSTKRYFGMRKREKENTIPFKELPVKLQESIDELTKYYSNKKIRMMGSAGIAAVGFVAGQPALFVISALVAASNRQITVLQERPVLEKIAAQVEGLRGLSPFGRLQKFKWFMINVNGDIVPTNRLPKLKTKWFQIKLGAPRMQLKAENA